MEYDGFDLEGYTMRTEESLPSKGRFYKSKFINFRGLRFKEKLAISKISNDTPSAESLRIIAEAYKNAVVVEGLEIYDMLFDDFYNMLFWVALVTDEKFALEFKYKCSCEHVNDGVVRGSDGELVMEDLGLNDKSIILKSSIGELTLTPPTLGNIIDFLSLGSDFEKDMRESVYIKRLDGELLSCEDRIRVLGALSMKDIDALRDASINLKSSLKPIKRKCEKCGEERDIHLRVDFKKALP